MELLRKRNKQQQSLNGKARKQRHSRYHTMVNKADAPEQEESSNDENSKALKGRARKPKYYKYQTMVNNEDETEQDERSNDENNKAFNLKHIFHPIDKTLSHPPPPSQILHNHHHHHLHSNTLSNLVVYVDEKSSKDTHATLANTETLSSTDADDNNNNNNNDDDRNNNFGQASSRSSSSLISLPLLANSSDDATSTELQQHGETRENRNDMATPYDLDEEDVVVAVTSETKETRDEPPTVSTTQYQPSYPLASTTSGRLVELIAASPHSTEICREALSYKHPSWVSSTASSSEVAVPTAAATKPLAALTSDSPRPWEAAAAAAAAANAAPHNHQHMQRPPSCKTPISNIPTADDDGTDELHPMEEVCTESSSSSWDGASSAEARQTSLLDKKTTIIPDILTSPNSLSTHGSRRRPQPYNSRIVVPAASTNSTPQSLNTSLYYMNTTSLSSNGGRFTTSGSSSGGNNNFDNTPSSAVRTSESWNSSWQHSGIFSSFSLHWSAGGSDVPFANFMNHGPQKQLQQQQQQKQLLQQARQPPQPPVIQLQLPLSSPRDDCQQDRGMTAAVAVASGKPPRDSIQSSSSPSSAGTFRSSEEDDQSSSSQSSSSGTDEEENHAMADDDDDDEDDDERDEIEHFNNYLTSLRHKVDDYLDGKDEDRPSNDKGFFASMRNVLSCGGLFKP